MRNLDQEKFDQDSRILEESKNHCEECQDRYFETVSYENKHGLNIFWLPENFSQSKFTKNCKGSNACTLIVLLLSKRIEALHRQKIDWWLVKGMDVNLEIFYSLAESILQGNALHEQMLARRTPSHTNLSIPEAISVGGRHLARIKEWKSYICLKDMASSLHGELKEKLAHCLASVPSGNIYVVLIALNRSVLLVVERKSGTDNNSDFHNSARVDDPVRNQNVRSIQHQGGIRDRTKVPNSTNDAVIQDSGRHGRITLFDSHQHYPHGAVILQTRTSQLQDLCSWYCSLLQHKCSVYELSFMYFPGLI